MLYTSFYSIYYLVRFLVVSNKTKAVAFWFCCGLHQMTTSVLFIISQLNCDAFGNVMSRIKALLKYGGARVELIHCSLMSLMDNVGRKLWLYGQFPERYTTHNTGNCVFHGDTFYCQEINLYVYHSYKCLFRWCQLIDSKQSVSGGLVLMTWRGIILNV